MAPPCRTPRCRRFSVRDAGGFGDLFCDFSPAWRCVSILMPERRQGLLEVYGDFRPTNRFLPLIAGYLLNPVSGFMTDNRKRQVITVQGH